MKKIDEFDDKYKIQDKIKVSSSKIQYAFFFVLVLILSDLANYFQITSKTGLFVFLFFSSLFLLIKFYQVISVFKESHKTQYTFSLIFVGFFLHKIVGNCIWFLLNTIGIYTSSNQQIINNIIDSHSQETFQIYFNIIFLSPIKEEIFFRGAILSLIYFVLKLLNINFKKGNIPFIIISSLLFGLSHDFNTWITVIPYVASGIIYCLFYLYAKSIIVPIGIHVLNNGFYCLYGNDSFSAYIPIILLSVMIFLYELVQYSNRPVFLKFRMFLNK